MKPRVYSLDYIAPNKLLHISHDSTTTETDYHTHEFFEIAYVSMGSYTHRINSVNHQVKRGDIIFLKIGDCHSYKSNEKVCKVTNILFYPELFKNNPEVLESYSKKINIHNIIHLNSKDIHQVESLIKYMEYEESQKRSDSLEIMRRYLDILLLIMTRSINESQNNDNKFDISPLLNYIAQNIKTVKPKDIAKKSSYNSAYFSKLFKDTMGINLVKYINEKRIDAAIKLITETDEPIENIAITVGFNEVNYFYKLFKQYTGCTPLSFRKNDNNLKDKE